MAKILLLALAVGLAHALSELEGHWVSTAIGADNVEKIANQGTMRLYARQIICHEECDKLEITFYVNLNGQCSETTVIGYKQEDGNYRTQFEGDNIFKPMVITKEFLVFISKNVDRDGLETHLLFALGKGQTLKNDQYGRLEELAKEQKIPPENIREVLTTGNLNDSFEL
ncbi:odorant-binding protein-like isoform X1 [Cricetulus griseus]|uniref:Odorant-binding protein-like isoform X2 n=1 Tax=Cricetulus griseus TaxID=10029 RepID=A0A9J7K0Q4_CRIGR|nr:odorant-binding protein-like isoform X1 [Cricetulus griseus]XP_027288171.1 odorant-binding protein-like isoform X2 [Cricetulus griseus]